MSVTYEYIDSRGAHGEFVDGVFERMVEARRQVWYGSDGSGLIRSTQIGWSFFTDEQRERWEAADSREAREDRRPSMDLFAPGCIGGHARVLEQLPDDVDELAAALGRTRRLSMHRIGELMGEALVPVALRQPLYEVAAGLLGAEAIGSAVDELGRSGLGVARVERGRREELIFDRDSRELLARREILVDAEAGYASPGATVGWTCYLARERVDALPEGTSPVPGPPCSPPGAGRVTLIERGFLLGTGYFTDLAPRLEQWHAEGVITDAQYQALKAGS